ncbi:uncharacterized protein LOC114534361 [Dendronephthya gigantea]|uniref:uncharacterized protein LOC114534361 n=1 Tax=Dendronephthya gigantea TaxID=151771 RepID=UPI00106953BD|nr:uncharacterized protein LOC114534361 [Dendronephthya gigantea]
MKVHKILQFDACLITCFFIGQIWSNARAEPFREECARKGIFKKKQKDSSLQNHIIKTIEVNHLAMCTIACLDHAQCKSYNFQETENPLKSCELSSSTKDSSSSDVISRPGYSYYDAQDEPPCYASCPGEKCVYTCSGPPTCKCPENIYYPVFQGRHCEYPCKYSIVKKNGSVFERTLGAFVTRDRKYQTCLIIGYYDTNDRISQFGPADEEYVQVTIVTSDVCAC